jgi:alcohol/geraniol dehydrogenase (NADP+)
MNNTIQAYAVIEPKGKFKTHEFTLPTLKPDDVEIKVDTCGVCHSDLSMVNNDWGMTNYPLVGGHEVIGKIAALGERVTHLHIGQTVGLGWFSGSCMTCQECMSGDHNLCSHAESTIVGRHGGFADRVRSKAAWAIPLPQGLDAAKAGPLFCGGITVFNPIVQARVQPTHRAAVIGIGGLGHMALQFLRAWGCEVTAFTSSDNKKEEARKLGAHHVLNTRHADDLAKHKGAFDFILSTVNVHLDWTSIMGTLAPKGRLHFVGAVDQPVSFPVFPMLLGQHTIGGSPLGSPATTAQMLDFCTRHHIAPITEDFPMSRIQEAFEHLESGKARYRVVLKNDFKN